MAAQVIDGRALAAQLRARVKAAIAAQGLTPGLAVVLVGDNPASAVYVAAKVKACAEVGIDARIERLAATITMPELAAQIEALNNDPAVQGILVQMPLPDHLDAAVILARVAPEKDVDGLHPLNLGRLMSGRAGLRPCTPLGVMDLILSARPDIAGLQAVVVGRSNLVGKPVAQMLLARDCTVTMAHAKTRDLAGLARQADIVVAAAGVPGLIGADHIKPGAIVIDVGITRGENGLRGDVDFDAVQRVAGFITPVPGGAGPMTVAHVLNNTLLAAQAG